LHTGVRSSGVDRFWIGLLAATAVLLLLALHALWRAWQGGDTRVLDAFGGGAIAAGATALGTLPVLFSQRLNQRALDTMLGFGAGVMLAASAFSLITPGINAAKAQGAGVWQAGLTVGAGILLGAALLQWLERTLPHEHFIKGIEHDGARNVRARKMQRVWLFVFAIVLHNFPEGLAIGVAFGGTDAARATALTTGIAIQDLPEGLVVAVALAAAGYRRTIAVGIGMASGLAEPIGAVLGAAVIAHSAMLLPWGLGFAAGAMLFVVSHEIIPESHRQGHEVFATSGLMLGFVLMMLLDTSLG
jgi:zinc transporter, ZIP family